MGKARSVSSLENEAIRGQKELSAINNQLPDNIAGPFQNFPEPQGAIPKALLIEGGIMKGPIAFKDSIEAIVSGKIDVGRTKSGYSSFVVVQAESGTTDDLTDIDNPAFPGQIIYLQADTGDTITVKNSGNISTSDGGDFTLSAEKVTHFVYVIKSAKWQQIFGTTAGSGTTLGGLTDVTITAAVKGDMLVYNGTAWVDLTVGTDGFFLKADSAQAEGVAWASSSATEVPVWTQNHDSDGFNLIADQDGDSAIIMSRDATNGADDQITIALGGLTNANFNFTNGIFSVFDTGTAEALQIQKTSVTGIINTTDALGIQVAGTNKVTINDTADSAFVIHDYTLNLLDVTSGEAATMDKSSTEFSLSSTDLIKFQIAGTDIIGISSSQVTVDQQVSIEKTTTNALLTMFRDDASPNDNDSLGLINFSGKDDATNTQVYAQIDAISDDVSSGAEDSSIRLITSENAGLTTKFTVGTTFMEFTNETTNPSGAELRLYSNRATPLDGDILSQITISGETDTGAKADFVELRFEAADVSNASKDGSVKLRVMDGNALNTVLTINDTSDNQFIVHDYAISSLASGGEAGTLQKNATEFNFNSTDRYFFQVAGTTKLTIDSSNVTLGTSVDLELVTNDLWLDEVADLTKISGTATTFNLTVGANSIFNASTSALTLQGSTTLSIPELFTMIATTATGVSDGVMWHDSGTGDVLVRSGGAERNLSDIAAGSPLTTKGDLFTFSTVDARLPVGTDGFFLKADSAQATGLVWASSAATEVPVWTQNHDTDGFNLFIDTDGNSGFIMDRDALIANDQLGLALGGIGTILFSWTKATNDGLFSVFEGGGEAIQLGKTVTEGFISSTDLLKLQIAGTDKLAISSTSLRMGTSVDIELVNNDLWFDEVADATKFSGTATGITMAVGGTNIFIASTSALTLQGTTTLSVPEFFQMVATAATSTTDGVMWLDSGTGNILCRTGGGEKSLTDIGSGGGASFPLTPTITDLSDTWSGNQTINLALAAAHVTKIILDQNLTWNTPTNPPASGTQIEFEIEYVQDGTGGFTVTQWAEVNETVTISGTANSTTIITYRTNDGGAIYHAVPSLRGSINLSGNFLPLAGGVMTGQIDTDGNEILLTADGLSNIGDGGVNGKIRLTVASNNILELTSTGVNIQSGINLDLNGESIIMDVDADSTISASVDDNIQISTGGIARGTFSNFNLLMAVDIDMFGNSLVLNTGGAFIHQVSSDMVFEVGASQDFIFEANNVELAKFVGSTGNLDMNDNNVFDIADLIFSDGNSFVTTPTRLTMNFPSSGDDFHLRFGAPSTNQYDFDIDALVMTHTATMGITVRNEDATPTNDDSIFTLNLFGDDSANNDTFYARMITGMKVVTSTTEAGLISLGVLTDGDAVPSIVFQVEGSASSGTKMGFFNTTPAVQQTGVAVTAAAIHAALVNYGIITA